jgi:hypothetical protein
VSSSPRDSGYRGRLPADVLGVRIGLAERPVASAPLVVHGAYRIPDADLVGVTAPAIRALVLVAQRDLAPHVVAPFAEQVLFDDDHVRTNAGLEGAFTLDVFELLGAWSEPRAGHYHLFVSLGPHVSNVLETDVAGR